MLLIYIFEKIVVELTSDLILILLHVLVFPSPGFVEFKISNMRWRNKIRLSCVLFLMSSFIGMQVKRLTDNAIVPTRGSMYAAGMNSD